MSSNIDKSNKAVFITGVRSGLGLGFAKHYLNNGDIVYGLSKLMPEDLKDYSNFNYLSADLSNHNLLGSCLENIENVLTEIDIAILNAGVVGQFGDMALIPLETMKNVMDINLWANKIILDCFIGKSIKVKQVVAISSGASVVGSRGWNAYSISKSSLNMMIQLYAHEMPDTHLFALAPGLVDTQMQAYLCGLGSDKKYPILDFVKSKKNTPEMPKPNEAALKIVNSFDRLLSIVESGGYADIRDL